MQERAELQREDEEDQDDPHHHRLAEAAEGVLLLLGLAAHLEGEGGRQLNVGQDFLGDVVRRRPDRDPGDEVRGHVDEALTVHALDGRVTAAHLEVGDRPEAGAAALPLDREAAEGAGVLAVGGVEADPDVDLVGADGHGVRGVAGGRQTQGVGERRRLDAALGHAHAVGDDPKLGLLLAERGLHVREDGRVLAHQGGDLVRVEAHLLQVVAVDPEVDRLVAAAADHAQLVGQHLGAGEAREHLAGFLAQLLVGLLAVLLLDEQDVQAGFVHVAVSADHGDDVLDALELLDLTRDVVGGLGSLVEGAALGQLDPQDELAAIRRGHEALLDEGVEGQTADEGGDGDGHDPAAVVEAPGKEAGVAARD
ncbi:hypothetical protein D3C86_1226840 [compost metagenome]